MERTETEESAAAATASLREKETARSSASRHSCMFLCMAVSFCRRARLF